MNIICKICLFLGIIGFNLESSECALQSSIPAHLLPCYRSAGGGGGGEGAAPRRLDVLLQLLRKLEAHPSQLDLRTFSVAVLRSLRLDGIEQSASPVETEHLTPYRATGFQFQRYRLLMDLLLPAHAPPSVHDALGVAERCLLHRAVSGGARRWQRGDEAAVCPLAAQRAATQTDAQSGRAYSRCPIEDGVVLTEWGTIAPGTVIAAIAAAMEAQTVAITDLLATDDFKSTRREEIPESNIETLDEVVIMPRIADAEINNVWVATLAGDLAEVAVNQGPRVGAVPQNISIGTYNRWNDTLLPRDYYMFPQNETIVQWHMTDAEIIAGIDGLIIAQEVRKWTSQMGSLRLSQILEMYYSNDGVSFNPDIKACNRQTNFYRIFDQTELLREMSNFAQVLSLSQGTVYVPSAEVDRICQAVVNVFVNYLSDVLNRNQKHCGGDPHVPAMDLVVVTDGAWTKYQTEQFISMVVEAAGVSPRRSSLGLLHGGTGLWVSPPTDNLVDMFENIRNFTDDWPNRLNFPVVLDALMQNLNGKMDEEGTSGVSVAPPTVVLVASTHDRLSTADLERSRELMTSLRRDYFDVHFAYLAQDLLQFYELNVELSEDDIADVYLQVGSTGVEEAARRVAAEVTGVTVPKRIVGAHCDFNGTTYRQLPYEDLVLVNQKITYRIHPNYLHDQPLITVEFRTAGQGTVRACAARAGADETSCHELGSRGSVVINVTRPCARSALCAPAYFSVVGLSTLNSCANSDCRSPSQVGFYLEHSGLRCLSRRNTAVGLMKDNLFLLICCFITFFMFRYNAHSHHVR